MAGGLPGINKGVVTPDCRCGEIGSSDLFLSPAILGVNYKGVRSQK